MKKFLNYIYHLKQTYKNLRRYYFLIYKPKNEFSKIYLKLYIKVFVIFLFNGLFKDVFHIKIRDKTTLKSNFDHAKYKLPVCFESELEYILSNNGFKITSEYLTCYESDYYFTYK